MPFPRSPIYLRTGEVRPVKRPNRLVRSVFVHCSASDNADHDDVSVIRRWHTEPKHLGGRGWSDVGYHLFICKDGTVQPGRPLERTPAAQRGHNTGTIAICLHGLSESRFTQAQLGSMVTLCRTLEEAYAGVGLRFRGHCEVANKACPVINYKAILGLDLTGRINGGGYSTPMGGPQEELVSEDGCLDLMDRGALVHAAQDALNRQGAALVVDGIFGQQTREAVIRFQIRRKLIGDGVIGPETSGIPSFWEKSVKSMT